ncbi:hypothetical protein [Vibrio sp. FJH11]
MTTDRKETEAQPTKPGIEIMAITILTILTVIFLLANHISESTFQARCRGHEERIEKSLQQTMAGEDERHLIQTNFQQYKKIAVRINRVLGRTRAKVKYDRRGVHMTEEEKAEVKKLINEQNKAIDQRIESQERELDALLNRAPWWHCFFNETLDVILATLCKGIILGILVFYLIINPFL